MDWRHMREILDAGQGVYSELKNVIVWVKNNGGMGSFYRSRHELIFALQGRHRAASQHLRPRSGGRYRTNVWEYRGMSSRVPVGSKNSQVIPPSSRSP